MKRFILASFIAFLSSAATIGVLARLVPGRPLAPGAGRAFTLEELGRHASEGDCWLAVDGGVYDVTSYLPSHPAPPDALSAWCGREASEAFRTKGVGRPHGAEARAALEDLRVGVLR